MANKEARHSSAEQWHDLTFNMGSYKAHKHELIAECNSFKYDSLCLQETLSTEQIFKSEIEHELESLGFRCYHTPVDPTRKRKGMITAIRATHPSRLIKQTSYKNDKEIHVVEIKVPGGFIELQNHYWNCSLPSIKPQLIQQLPDAKSCRYNGDFNAHHISMQGSSNNSFGNGIRDILDKNLNIIHIPTKHPTTKAGTFIDKVFVSANLKKKTECKVLDLSSGGSKAGHFALHVSTKTPKYLDHDDFVPKLKFDENSFPDFRNCLEKKLGKKDIFENINPENVNESARLLGEAYYEAAIEIFPHTKFHDHPWRSWYWNTRCEEARNRVNYWSRVNRKRKFFIPGAKQKLLDAKAFAEKVYEESILTAWPKICESLTLADNNSKNWKRIMFIKNGGIPPPKVKDMDPEKKAIELADSFAQRTHSNNLSKKITDTMKVLSDLRDIVIKQAIECEDKETDYEITDFEVNKVTNITKSSSPGDDKITYPMIKESGPIAKSTIKKIYSTIWNSGKMVKAWKIAAQIPLPKDKERINFRPISLLSAFSKHLERIAKDRLMLKISHKMHQNVFGYTKKRGTTDGNACLTQKIGETLFRNNGIIRGKSKRCLVIFLDLEKAFELASPSIILYELAKLGVKGKLLRFIQDYLNDRKGYVSFEGFKSHLTDFENGVPQGGILSPFLFNVLVNNIVSRVFPPGVEVYSYADDLVLICNDESAEEKLQKTLEQIETACEELGLKINIGKTKYMIFSNIKDCANCSFKISGKLLERVFEFKYLGVIYTPKLGLNAHFTELKEKFYKKQNIFKAIAGTKWGTDTSSLLTFYKGSMRSALEYGNQNFGSFRPNQRERNSLEVLQNNSIKMALGIPTRTENSIARIESGTAPLTVRSNQASSIYLAKLMLDPRPHPLKEPTKEIISVCNNYQTRFGLERPLNLRSFVENNCNLLRCVPDMWGLIQLPTPSVKLLAKPKLPLGHNSTIEIFELDKSKSSLSDVERVGVRDFFEAKIKEKNCRITIYTDASINPTTGKAGYAMIPHINNIPEHDHQVISSVSPDGHGSMTCELGAILEATETAKQLCQPGENFLIVTDSKSGLDALKTTDIDDNEFLINSIHNNLGVLHDLNIQAILMWCPSHIGIKGNELADALAGISITSTCKTTYIPPSFSRVKSQIKKYVDYTWKTNQSFSHETYSILNPDLKPYKVPKCPRYIQSAIAGLRCNSYNMCSHYSCNNICKYCDSTYSTEHYMLDCPANHDITRPLLQLLEPEEFQFSSKFQAALILKRLNQSSYDPLIKVIKKKPPKFYCKNHSEPSDTRNIPFL